MIRARSWFSRLVDKSSSQSKCVALHTTDTAPAVESLENRLLLSSSHRRIYPVEVTSTTADNRGLVMLTFSQPVNPKTVTAASVQFIIGRRNRGAGLSFSKDNMTMFIQHAVPANTGYRVLLDATKIKGANGLFLDGEFKAAANSGNGVQGGNFDFTTTGTSNTAIFSTVAGNMNVNLLTSTALTSANFLKYANAGDWDNTFLHRSVQSGFKIVQGGGFKLGINNSIVPVTSRGNINNETGLTDVRGTIAMANAGLNTNNTQWYFNNGDNAAAFGNNYTVFGSLADATSFRVMDALGGLPIFNATKILNDPRFSELPVVNHTGTGLSTSNLAWIYRVAIKDSVAKTPGT